MEQKKNEEPYAEHVRNHSCSFYFSSNLIYMLFDEDIDLLFVSSTDKSVQGHKLLFQA